MATHFPRLTLGDRRAKTITSADQYVSLAQQARRPVADISFRHSASQMKFSSVQVGDLTITEGYSEAIRIRSYEDPQLTFIIPLRGSGRFVVGTKITPWRASRSVLQVSYDKPMAFEADGYLLIALRLCPGTFMKELRNLLPGEHPTMDSLLHCGVLTHEGGTKTMDVSAALNSIFSMIASTDADESLLQRIGVDDVIYRLLAEMVSSRSGCTGESDRTPGPLRSSRAVDVICDFITGNIGSPLTIGKMEKLVGLSGRAISYAFQQRFGCSPQEWQRSFLLDEARRRLSDGDPALSIKRLSYDLGFASASSFTAHYRRKFGELPSLTLRSVPFSPAHPRSNMKEG